MKTCEELGISPLSNLELQIVGSGDPFSHDLGYAIGKITGWIKNAISNSPKSDETWMLEVPPVTLFG